MRKGIDLLRSALDLADDLCACDRAKCKPCSLRHELAEYLLVADRGAPATSTPPEAA